MYTDFPVADTYYCGINRDEVTLKAILLGLQIYEKYSIMFLTDNFDKLDAFDMQNIERMEIYAKE